jgi:hypothetical protein
MDDSINDAYSFKTSDNCTVICDTTANLTEIVRYTDIWFEGWNDGRKFKVSEPEMPIVLNNHLLSPRTTQEDIDKILLLA